LEDRSALLRDLALRIVPGFFGSAFFYVFVAAFGELLGMLGRLAPSAFLSVSPARSAPAAPTSSSLPSAGSCVCRGFSSVILDSFSSTAL
jgi:hypothetical protein